MEIKGKVHCFFEQSGTFKREFIKLGIPAEDYDIQNNFGETDHTDDLFAEILKAYDGEPSLFDTISKDDLILAFFPCIYFCTFAELNASCPDSLAEARGWDIATRRAHQLEFSRKRQEFYELALKMTAVVEIKGLRMIVENPWSEQNYTYRFWFNKPALIDRNRRLRGDYFMKPTAYWFINCEPTHGRSFQPTPASKVKRVLKHDQTKRADSARQAKKKGICSEERSMISPDYARNFICDFIIGKEQEHTERTLFDL